jgi:hypothetical protein
VPDNFDTFASGLSSPARALVKVTKSDTVDIATSACRALLVGVAGSATLIDASGAEQIGVPLQQGYNPIMVRRVKTGGTADGIWALY